MTVHRSDRISKVMILKQSSETVSVPQSTAELHLEERETLRIYVPKEELAFKRCWPQQIQPRFKSWLGVSDVNGDTMLQTIFWRADDLNMLDYHLEYEGIKKIEGVSRPSEADSVEAGSDSQSSISTFSSHAVPSTPVGSTGFSANLTRSASSVSSIYSTPHTLNPGRLTDPSTQILAYRNILDGIIRAAQITEMPERMAPAPTTPSNPSAIDLQLAFWANCSQRHPECGSGQKSWRCRRTLRKTPSSVASLDSLLTAPAGVRTAKEAWPPQLRRSQLGKHNPSRGQGSRTLSRPCAVLRHRD